MSTLVPTAPARHRLKAPRLIVTGLVATWSLLGFSYAVAALLLISRAPVLIVGDTVAAPPLDGPTALMLLWWLSFLLLPNAAIMALLMRRWPGCPSATRRVAAALSILGGATLAWQLPGSPLWSSQTNYSLLVIEVLGLPLLVFALLGPSRSELGRNGPAAGPPWSNQGEPAPAPN